MKKLLMLAAMFCLLLSCTKQEIPTDEKIPINISVGQQTRANDSNFQTDDKVGIYVVNYNGETAGSLANSGNHVDNIGFEYNGSAWAPDETIYWKDKKTSADFYAYYPHDANLSSVTEYPFSVKTNQSEDDNFWASDFLWGKQSNVTPTSEAVTIQTNHVLSRIIVEIKPGAGFTADTWAAATKSVKITGMKTAATINLSNGTATATGSAEDITPLHSVSTYKAMAVPQTVADNSKLIVVTVNGVDYIYRKGYEFKANTQHSFTITVNKSTSNVNVTIGEWVIDPTVNTGSATEEEEEISIPNNQIWYTSSNNQVINPDASYTGESGFGANIITNNYSNGKGIITFDGDIKKIGDRAFENNSLLTSVTIPEGVITIGPNAFKSCSSLSNITVPNSVTSLGSMSFYGCTSLSEVILSDNLTSIGGSAFLDCSSLTNIVLPSKLTEIGTTAFYGCMNLITVTSLASTAPTINNFDVFDPDSRTKTTLIVPQGSKNSYIEKGWNNYFSNIEEIE